MAARSRVTATTTSGVSRRWAPRPPSCRSNEAARSGRLARRDRLLAAIVVEAAAGFAAQPAGLDVLHQQRTRPVFRIGQALVQDVHDRQNGVEADEVTELERAHRMV